MSYKEHQTSRLALVTREIKEFAESLERKIAEHDSARGDEWKEMSLNWLLARLDEEVDELEDEILCLGPGDNPRYVQHECLDVAAFAMFIYHVAEKGGSNDCFGRGDTRQKI
jgi:NTP pyrophosphatase (non-canonical NTP hydrolase)